jgi:toluene monooxygenase system ferredoxin subunit
MSKVRVCKTDEIPANGMKGYELAGKRVLIAQAGDRFYAYQGLCPHQDVCLDEGFYDGAVLTCHQHLWQWDITTGEAMGLAESPLERYDVAVTDGEIFVVQATALQAAEIFAGIGDETLAKLNALAHSEEYESGKSLYTVGDAAEDLFILDSGRVEFLIGREGHATAAGFMLRKGEVFGWNALLEHQPSRIARASCIEKSTVLRLSGKEALKVLEADPASGYQVMRRLANLVAKYLTLSGAK